MKLNSKNMVKGTVYLAVAAGFFTMAAYADAIIPAVPPNSIGAVAATVIASFGNLAQMISATAYIAGFAFIVASMFKFKQHKDNPQQVPVTNGIAMLSIGAALIFAPSIFQMVGATLFGTSAQTAGVTGITTVPGQSN